MFHERYTPRLPTDLTMTPQKQEEFRRIMFSPPTPPPRIFVVHGRCGTGKRCAVEVLLKCQATPNVREYNVTFVDCVEFTIEQLVSKIDGHILSSQAPAFRQRERKGGKKAAARAPRQQVPQPKLQLTPQRQQPQIALLPPVAPATSKTSSNSNNSKKAVAGTPIVKPRPQLKPALRTTPIPKRSNNNSSSQRTASQSQRSNNNKRVINVDDDETQDSTQDPNDVAFNVDEDDDDDDDPDGVVEIDAAEASQLSQNRRRRGSKQQPAAQKQERTQRPQDVVNVVDQDGEDDDAAAEDNNDDDDEDDFQPLVQIRPIPVLVLRNPPAVGERSGMSNYQVPLRDALNRLARHDPTSIPNSTPIVTIILLTDHDLHSIKLELLQRLPGPVHATAIFFNVPPVTEVNLKKRLKAVLELERLSSRVDDKVVELIASAAEGDIRHALLQLEWYILPIRDEMRRREEAKVSPRPAAVDKKSKKDKDKKTSNNNTDARGGGGAAAVGAAGLCLFQDLFDEPAAAAASKPSSSGSASTTAAKKGAAGKIRDRIEDDSDDDKKQQQQRQPGSTPPPNSAAATNAVNFAAALAGKDGKKKNNKGKGSSSKRKNDDDADADDGKSNNNNADGAAAYKVDTDFDPTPSGQSVSIRDELTSAAHTVGRMLVKKRTAEYAMARTTVEPKKLLGYIFENAHNYFEPHNIRDLSRATSELAHADMQMAERFFDVQQHQRSFEAGGRDATGMSDNSEAERALFVFGRCYQQLNTVVPKKAGQVMPPHFVQTPQVWRDSLPPPPVTVPLSGTQQQFNSNGSNNNNLFGMDDLFAQQQRYDQQQQSRQFDSNNNGFGNKLRRVDNVQRLSGAGSLTHILVTGNVIQFPPSDYTSVVTDTAPMAARILFGNINDHHQRSSFPPAATNSNSSSMATFPPQSANLSGGFLTPHGGTSPLVSQAGLMTQHNNNVGATSSSNVNNSKAPKRTLFAVKQREDAAAQAAAAAEKLAAAAARSSTVSKAAVSVLSQTFVPKARRHVTVLRGDIKVFDSFSSPMAWMGEPLSAGAGARDPTALDPIEDA